MEPVIGRITADPGAYLIEVSLLAFRSYLRGYFLCLNNYGIHHPESKLLSEFNDWTIEKYGAWPAGHDAASIIQSYSVSDEDAYRKFVQELDEFSRDRLGTSSSERIAGGSEARNRLQTFKEILADMRSRPPIYIAVASFRGAAAYLLGHVRAGQDFNLPADESETEFLEFQKWVERKRNKGLPRSWYQLVLFHSATDCNHNERGAFNVFYDWYDQFRKERNENARRLMR
jgi:hypothetical protein